MSELLIKAANARLAPYAVMYVTHNIEDHYNNMWDWMMAEERSPMADFLVVSFMDDFPKYYELSVLIKTTLESKFGPYEAALEDAETVLLQVLPDGEMLNKVSKLFALYRAGSLNELDKYIDNELWATSFEDS